MPDILHLLTIRAPRERVYAALATADGIRSWWTRDATLEARLGGTGRFGFHDRRTVTTVRIAALEPPGRVDWETVASTLPAWPGTRLSFELRPAADGTFLAFAHRGFAAADDIFARFSTGWACYLLSLRDYLETGTGAPHPEMEGARLRA